VRELAEAARAGVTHFMIASAAGGQRTLRVRAAPARVVEIAGDFTGWQPARLEPAGGGWWVVTLRVPAGTHQVAVRVDGGRWLVPPGLLAILDEFGGAAGVLIIP
jgi:1,4-alpha-glucan branching enzyme